MRAWARAAIIPCGPGSGADARLSRFRFARLYRLPHRQFPAVDPKFADRDAFPEYALRVCLPGGIAPHKEHCHDSGPLRSMIRSEGVLRYRDLPWRRTRDPYIIWLSEVMLQQTQVPRVEARMPAWLDRFPTVRACSGRPFRCLGCVAGDGLVDRRALALHRAAQCVVEDWDGEFPREMHDLVALPGIGPATAQGIRSFAFDLPGVYLRPTCARSFCIISFPMCRPFPIACWCR